MRASRLPVALRAYAEPTQKNGRQGWRAPVADAWPKDVLAFDIETTTDTKQRLVFGWYRVGKWSGEKLSVREEGITYADELPERDPDAYDQLLTYQRTHEAEAERGLIELRSRSEFVEEIFMTAAYRAGAMVVGFNLPFDLSRLAVRASPAKSRGGKGFSFVLSVYRDRRTGQWKENKYRPRVIIEHVNAKRARMRLTRPKEVEPGTPMARDKNFRGRFLDLRTLAFGLTAKGHSLASGCEAFGVLQGKSTTDEHGRVTEAYIEYARQDVRATAELLVKMREEFDRHPIALPPDWVASSASIAKAYLTAMGVGQPLDRFASFPHARLGHAMTAFYGGRVEVHIRRTEVPVTYCDFLSMYPTVNTLMGLWWLLTAADIECVDAADEVRAFLEDVEADDLAKPETWRRFPAFALIEPDGDILPVRAEYGADRSQNIGVNPLMPGGGPQWYALPDLVASKLLTGRAPKILEAFKLVPTGQVEGLQVVKLRGSIPIDPRSDDFFRVVIEERRRLLARELPAMERKRLHLFLKVLANSGSYGIYGEMNRKQLPKGATRAMRIYGVDRAFTEEVEHPEMPGRFSFPPIAALITAGARLMLALLERHVTSLGAVYAFCDTDSMAIVATETGGLVACPGGPECLEDGTPAIRALSWSEVDEVVSWFEQLNPYNREAVPGSVLKIEAENFSRATGTREQLYVFAISAKRYALYNKSGGLVRIRKASEHSLGHLMNPARSQNGEHP